MKEQISQLKIHEYTQIDENLKVQRVISGFNYIYLKRVIIEESTGKYKTEITHIVFVPFNKF